ncbi:hypothetical protein AB0I60_14770 [Actinosynnema sp. NPDC050436]|uniref:hypothetical protein n=1 Tax=Actinosynnema sp. NPDC050436 TaxID=3155659 RepID=UPI0033FA8DB8
MWRRCGSGCVLLDRRGFVGCHHHCGGGSCGGGAGRSQGFEDYKNAARAKDGKGAVQAMSNKMLSTYLELKELALTSSEEQTARLGTTWRLVVYTLRAEFGASELRAMTSADVVAAAVEKGLISEGALDRVLLGSIEVNGDTAKAEVTTADGQASGLALEFTKEFGLWKFNPEPLLYLGDQAFEYAAEQQGLTVDQFVDRTLSTLYGADRLPGLKQPLER